MNVGGDNMGECQCLIPETEIESNNAGLSDVTALCGEWYEYMGSYNVKSYASLRSMGGMEGYLEEEAETLCPECLEIAVRHHGWPETPAVKRRLISV